MSLVFKRIKVIRAIPSFVCPKTYVTIPPLEKGDIVILPEEVCSLIVRKKRALMQEQY